MPCDRLPKYLIGGVSGGNCVGGVGVSEVSGVGGRSRLPPRTMRRVMSGASGKGWWVARFRGETLEWCGGSFG